MVVLTRDSADRLQNDWQLDYKSTQTIYEHEYLLIANEDEFNVSQNPSAIVEIGRVTEFITGSDNKIYKTTINPGVKYIRKKTELPTGEIIDYRYSGSVGNTKAGFKAVGSIHRIEYGLKWNVMTEATAVVADEVNIVINLEFAEAK